MKNAYIEPVYYDIEEPDMEDSSIPALKTYTSIKVLCFLVDIGGDLISNTFNIEVLIDPPKPCSCRVADRKCRMQFCAGHKITDFSVYISFQASGY